MTTINGLPAHGLLVHVIVVFIPLAAVLLAVVACWPPARRRLSAFTAIVAAVALVSVPLTTQAGRYGCMEDVMETETETVPVSAGAAMTARGSLLLRVLGVIGCLAVAAIHVIDQGGLPGTKDPQYVQIMYYALEAAGVAAAALLVTRQARVGWLLAVGVAAGPILGYVLSRGPGLPNYTDDVGNWTEPLGVISLVVEGALLIVTVAALLTGYRRAA